MGHFPTIIDVGLLLQVSPHTCTTAEGARGSSHSLMLIFLHDIDPAWTLELFHLYETASTLLHALDGMAITLQHNGQRRHLFIIYLLIRLYRRLPKAVMTVNQNDASLG